MKLNLLSVIAASAFSFTFSTVAFATSLNCTLQSGNVLDTVHMTLEAPFEFLDSQGAYDLNFQLQTECHLNECAANMTILSSIVEDEVGQLAFEFLKSDRGEVFREELTSAPDKRAYTLTCDVRN